MVVQCVRCRFASLVAVAAAMMLCLWPMTAAFCCCLSPASPVATCCSAGDAEPMACCQNATVVGASADLPTRTGCEARLGACDDCECGPVAVPLVIAETLRPDALRVLLADSFAAFGIVDAVLASHPVSVLPDHATGWESNPSSAQQACVLLCRWRK